MVCTTHKDESHVKFKELYARQGVPAEEMVCICVRLCLLPARSLVNPAIAVAEGDGRVDEGGVPGALW